MLSLCDGRSDDVESLQEQDRLIEDCATVRIDAAGQSAVAALEDTEQGPMLVCHTVSRVFVEEARPFDFPRADVVLEFCGAAVDCDGDPEFPASSSSR